jgi:hypothetical protein
MVGSRERLHERLLSPELGPLTVIPDLTGYQTMVVWYSEPGKDR